MNPEPTTRRGLACGLAAYLLWGFLPLYWKQLGRVPALEIICHRILWSMAFTAALLAWKGGLGATLARCREPRLLVSTAWTASLLGCNWLIFIYSVNSGHVLQSSLGYFISPLVSAALGVGLLRERLSPAQTLAFGLATGGVLVQGLAAGQSPWLALALAVTFALYGLGRKVTPFGAVEGLFAESAVLAGPALLWLGLLGARGVGAFGLGEPTVSLWLAGAGVATSTPLILFAAAARRMPLSMLGLLQYLSPSMQFLMGVFLFHEAFSWSQGLAFALIWGGLALYSAAGLASRRQLPKEALQPQALE